MIQIIYQPDRNVPFDCGRKLPKNRPVRHKGGAGLGEDDPTERVECACVGQTQPEKERMQACSTAKFRRSSRNSPSSFG